MKVIISEEQSDKVKQKLKDMVDKFGPDSLGIDLYKLIEMGVIEKYMGKLNLYRKPIKSLGDLEFVGGYLSLIDTKLESLGKLEWVGGGLSLSKTNITDLGNLVYVGGDLYLRDCPLSKLSDEEINKQVFVGGEIIR